MNGITINNKYIEYTNMSSVAIANKSQKRIMRDVARAMESDDIRFMYDDETGAGYVMFEAPGSLYHGQKHIIEIKFVYGSGDDIYRYPFDPPLLTFKTPIYHPNIGNAGSGIVCLDFLKSKDLWNPSCTIESILVIIAALLSDPNPDSPQNADAGRDFMNMDAKAFRKKCRAYYRENDRGPEYTKVKASLKKSL